MKTLIPILLCALSAAQCKSNEGSLNKNVYKEDLDGERRRVATAEEMRYAMHFGDCTYSLIARDLSLIHI